MESVQRHAAHSQLELCMHSSRPATCAQAATEVRKEVNELDNLTTGKAVDVLLNYETVKLFNNEQHEVDQYDAYLQGFQVRLLCFLFLWCCCRQCC